MAGAWPRRWKELLVTETRPVDLLAALDEAKLSRFHLRAVLVSGWASSPTPMTCS